MPSMPPKPCRRPGCPALVYDGSGYCAKHQPASAGRQAQRDHDARRPNATQRGYGHRWRQARVWYLREHPLCVACQARGVLAAAVVVDHVRPHRGNPDLFWDDANWQALCKACHDSKTAREERSGAPGGPQEGGGTPPGGQNVWSPLS